MQDFNFRGKKISRRRHREDKHLCCFKNDTLVRKLSKHEWESQRRLQRHKKEISRLLMFGDVLPSSHILVSSPSLLHKDIIHSSSSVVESGDPILSECPSTVSEDSMSLSDWEEVQTQNVTESPSSSNWSVWFWWLIGGSKPII